MVLIGCVAACGRAIARSPDRRFHITRSHDYPITRFTLLHETIIVLDFGSQFTQLIARRLRELSVYSEILPFDTPMAEIAARAPRGIILSGGPKSVSDPGAPRCDTAVFDAGVPVLGICYGRKSVV